MSFGLRDGGSDIETLSIFLEASALTLADAGAHLLPDLLRHGSPRVKRDDSPILFVVLFPFALAIAKPAWHRRKLERRLME